MQTILVVVVSVLLTALLVLLLGKKNESGATTAVEGGASGDVATETDQQIAARLMEDSRALGQRLQLKDTALKEALSSKEGAEQARDGITDQMLALKAQVSNLSQEASANTGAVAQVKLLQVEVENGKKLNHSYLLELQKLRSADTSRLLKAENTRLMNEVALLRSDAEQALKNLAAAKQNITDGFGDKAQLTAYKEEYNSAKKEVARLKNELNRFRLFVEKASDLSPNAAAFVEALKVIKSSGGDALEAAYGGLETQANAKKLNVVRFNEGVSTVGKVQEGLLAKSIASSGEKSFILVVGYASNTGNKATNFALSSKRATAVATIVQKLKAEGQTVKALFLGQTDRFSKSEASQNQLCEIWELKR